MEAKELNPPTGTLKDLEPMPVLFIGHGNPMNAIEENEFSRGWRDMARTLPRPKAILCISAHWETRGTFVTAMDPPRTIHDFGGFPPPLYEVRYPAPGSQQLAQDTQNIVKATHVGLDMDWGLDHGCWSVLMHMFPSADVPVIQMSLDSTQPAQYHYHLAEELAPLRQKGVLILGSGNIVHNLRRVVIKGNTLSDFNHPFGLDWALEANQRIKQLINEGNHEALIHYPSLGSAVQLAIPTPEHYLPMLYAIALKQKNESVSYFNDQPVAGSLTMTSLKIELASTG